MSGAVGRVTAIFLSGLALGIAGGRWTGVPPTGVQIAAHLPAATKAAAANAEAPSQASSLRTAKIEAPEPQPRATLKIDSEPAENPFLRAIALEPAREPEPQGEPAFSERAAPTLARADAGEEPGWYKASEQPSVPAALLPIRSKQPEADETPQRTNHASTFPELPPALAKHGQEDPKSAEAPRTEIAEAANQPATVPSPPQAEAPPATPSPNAPQTHASLSAPKPGTIETSREHSEPGPEAKAFDPAAPAKPAASTRPDERTPPEAAVPALPGKTTPVLAVELDSNGSESLSLRATEEGPGASPRTGRDVQKMLNERYRGKDSKMLVSTLLINRNGERRIHDFVRYRCKENALSKTLLCFLAPADVRKTSTLTIERSGEDDYQRLYLPALKKNRIISAPEMGKSWMGTDFSFEDLREKKLDHFEYSRLETGSFEGLECWCFEMTPKSPQNSSYARLETWVRKDIGELARRKYYNRKGECIKELIPRHYKKFEDSTLERPVWLATYMEMTALHDRHQSVFVIEWVVFNINARNELFSPRGMENPVLDFSADERRRLLKGEESNWRQ